MTAIGLAGGRERRLALEHGAHDQALERDPDREQIEDLLAGEHRDVRAAVALADEQPLVAQGLDRFAHRRAGDAEVRRELGLGEARPRRDDAVEDAGAQRGDDGLAGGDGLDGETAHGTSEGRRSRVRRERSPQGARRDGPQAGAARLRPAPGGAADVQDRVRIGVDLGGMRRDVLERVVEEVERPRAVAARHGEHTAARSERERHGLARPRQRPRHRDHGREQLVAVAPDAVAALAGEPLEPAGQPVAAGQRLDAAAQPRAAVERALAVAARHFVRHGLDGPGPVDQRATAGERDDLDHHWRGSVHCLTI